jgi:hypothetical protein
VCLAIFPRAGVLAVSLGLPPRCPAGGVSRARDASRSSFQVQSPGFHGPPSPSGHRRHRSKWTMSHADTPEALWGPIRPLAGGDTEAGGVQDGGGRLVTQLPRSSGPEPAPGRTPAEGCGAAWGWQLPRTFLSQRLLRLPSLNRKARCGPGLPSPTPSPRPGRGGAAARRRCGTAPGSFAYGRGPARGG